MLAGNLNELSGRLSEALDELKNANAMLLEDVAREKQGSNQSGTDCDSK